MLLQTLLPTAELRSTDQHHLDMYFFCFMAALPALRVAGEAFPAQCCLLLPIEILKQQL